MDFLARIIEKRSKIHQLIVENYELQRNLFLQAEALPNEMRNWKLYILTSSHVTLVTLFSQAEAQQRMAALAVAKGAVLWEKRVSVHRGSWLGGVGICENSTGLVEFCTSIH